ncbi:MAG: hypothetical protein M3552_06150 [Planctomycetota bacterium]|nr:sigma-70 family RNA polymerase sigma factor [Planctomycetaceae bacterium]MDQ3330218.1 hypothetical protein [Planctomycetota bacterium]
MSADEHLSRIETLWSVVRRANTPEGTRAAEAQEELLDRYGGAIRRYLHACLRDRDAADEVFQEFSLRFVRGDFRSADPEKGRFRSFVKTIIYRLMMDHHRKAARGGGAQALAFDPAESEGHDTSDCGDELFLSSWRDELLSRTWSSLEDHERTSGSAYYTALRLRVEEPDLRSAQLAERLTQRLGKPMTPEAVRVLVHRARERFAELMIGAVAESIEDDSPDAIEDELIDLRLLEYCRETLQKRRKR